MHPKDNVLRAWMDQELPEIEAGRVSEHVSLCMECQRRQKVLAGRSQRVQASLDALGPKPSELRRSPQAAFARINNPSWFSKRQPSGWKGLFAAQLNPGYIPEKELKQTMFTRRPLWTALAIIAALALIFTLTPANAWASSFLGLFRVQKVQVVTFDPSAAENARGQLEANQQAIKQVFRDDLKITSHGKAQPVASAAEAAQQVGFTPRVPASLADPKLTIKPGMNAIFTINQPKLQALIDTVGANVKLPAEVNGKVMTVDVPDAVTVTSGCPSDAGAAAVEKQVPANCTMLVQMPSPTVNAPEGLNVEQMGEAMFQFLGVSPEQAQALSQRIDWTSTLILPIPQGGSIQYQDVQVDGVSGTLLQEVGEGSYSLVWVKDGILYGLHGPGSAQDALKVAGSLK